MLNDIVTRTRLKNKVQSFISIKLKINFLKKTYTYVPTYNAAQFIYFSENVKRESFEQFLVLKKKIPIALYLAIITARIDPDIPRTNPYFLSLCALCVSPRRRSSFHEQRITEPYRREWKGYSVKKLARQELGMHTGNDIRYGGHFAHSMYHGPKMDRRENASWIPFIFRNRQRF